MTTVSQSISNSQRLRHKIEMVLPQLMAAGAAIDEHPRMAELYPEYLMTLHFMIRASVPLMETARSQALAMGEGDKVAAGVAAYLRQHIREEMHHDDWLLDDLETLGFDRAELLKRPPPPSVAAMVGSQYYWTFHYHPVALLGYIAVLEGYPPSVEHIEEHIKKTRLPREAFRTLIKHAHLDPHHRDGLNDALDTLPLEPQHTAILGVSAMHTIHTASQALREVVERYPYEEAAIGA